MGGAFREAGKLESGLDAALSPPQEAAKKLSESLQSVHLSETGLIEAEDESAAGSNAESAPLTGEDGNAASQDSHSSNIQQKVAEKTGVPLEIDDSSVNRAQIRQRFLDLHFGTSRLAPFVFVYEVFDTDRERQLLTTSAADTMCIAQMASSSQDSYLMSTAQTMYSSVAQAICRRLQKISGSAGIDTAALDDLFGGVHGLISCGYFSGLDINVGDREAHVHGLKSLTKAIPNERISDSIREAFKHKWGRQGFWLAIKQRKDLSRVDCRIDFAARWRITDSERLSRTASQVPGLLERSDDLLSRRTRHPRVAQRDLLALLNALEAAVAALKRWQVQWESSIPSPYQSKSIKAFEAFRGISGSSFEVFKTAYSFTNSASERDFRVLQICLLGLDLTIIKLHQAFPRLVIDREVQIQLRRARFGAEMAVEALCM